MNALYGLCVKSCKNSIICNLMSTLCAKGVVLLCMNVLDVQTRRHFPDEIVHCFQRAVISTQPVRCTDSSAKNQQNPEIFG